MIHLFDCYNRFLLFLSFRKVHFSVCGTKNVKTKISTVKELEESINT